MLWSGLKIAVIVLSPLFTMNSGRKLCVRLSPWQTICISHGRPLSLIPTPKKRNMEPNVPSLLIQCAHKHIK